MIEAACAIAQVVTVVVSLLAPQPVTLTWYGGENDGYLGQHHAAYWNGLDCGLPAAVDEKHFGTAAPASVPFCSQVIICYHRTKCVQVVVVDRQRDDILTGLPHFDLWPAPAAALGIIEFGIVEGRAYGLLLER